MITLSMIYSLILMKQHESDLQFFFLLPLFPNYCSIFGFQSTKLISGTQKFSEYLLL